MTQQSNNSEIKLNQHLAVVFNEILPALTSAGIKYWVFGGVGVAGVLGRFIRKNQDVDVYILDQDFVRVKSVLNKLCESHDDKSKECWSLSSSVLKETPRWKLDISVREKKIFSVVPIYKLDDGAEFRVFETRRLSSEAFVQELRLIDGYQFFCPPRDIIIELLRFLVERYIKYYDKKPFTVDCKHRVDAKALLTREEFNELVRRYESKNSPKISHFRQQFNNRVISYLEKIDSIITAHSQENSKNLSAVREKIRWLGLKMEGIKKVQPLLDFINQLERNGLNAIDKFIILSKAVAEERANRQKGQNFEARIFESYNNPERLLYGRNKTPFHFQLGLARKIAESFKASAVSASTFKLLRAVGYFPAKNNLNSDQPKDFRLSPSKVISEISRYNLFDIFERYKDWPQIQSFIVKNGKKIASVSPSKIDTCLDIFRRIDNSSRQEIKRLRNSLVAQLLGSDCPSEDYQKIEAIFAPDNVSSIDKVYEAFKILYSPERLKKQINQQVNPFWQSTNIEKYYDIIYQDLSKINVQSRDQIKVAADRRNRQLVNKARTESIDNRITLNLEVGDFIKGVDIYGISNILENGLLAEEFLGDNFNLVNMPFGIGVGLVEPDNIKKGISDLADSYLSKDFGGILLVLKNRGQYQLVEAGRYRGIRTGFPSTEIDFMMVKNNLVFFRPKELRNIFFEIAQWGYYLPIVNELGEIIFTPEMYDEYRQAFAGLEKFKGEELFFRPTTVGQKSYPQLLKIITRLGENRERVDRISKIVCAEIELVLKNLEVNQQSKFKATDSKMELFGIGSTSRQTNTFEDFDLDLTLKLDDYDLARVTEIARSLESIMIFTKEYFYQETGGHYQLRTKGLASIGKQKLEIPIDLDISLVSKAALERYRNHNAIIDKFNYIRNHYGRLAYEQTIANIILTKQILKERHVYKTGKEGGFRGIGTENWILASGGNMEEAFKNFQKAAYENGERLSHEKFLTKYKILDAGVTNVLNIYQNHIEVLRPGGYEVMLDIIDDYFKDGD